MFNRIRHTTASSSSSNDSSRSPQKLLCHLSRRFNSFSSSERSSSSLSDVVRCYSQKSSCDVGSSSSSSSSTSNHLAAWHKKLSQDEKKQYVTVPLEIVQDLLLGNLDPVRFAQDNLPAEDVAAVLHLERDQRHQKVDLKHHRICTREDVLLVGLTYAGFDSKRQNVCRKTNNERFCAFYKLLPESILDAKNYFDEYDDGITFERFLFTLNFLKLCKCQLFLISLRFVV